LVPVINMPRIALTSTSARTLASPPLIVTGTDVSAVPSRTTTKVGMGAELGAAI
jgi:hypothetical protein